VGPNGAGKTNLLESLHVGTQGFSPRTRADAQLVRFGADGARVVVRGSRGEVPVETEVVLRHGGGRDVLLNGARVERMDRLRSELATLVFTPDRLAVVKGGPAVRRAYVDRALGRLLPAQAGLPAAYGEAVGQRNASLRRVALGLSSREALCPWSKRVADLGAELHGSRRRVLDLLAPAFAERAGELGLEGAALEYRGDPPTVAALDARIDRDLERGATGLGPHLDDIAVLAGRAAAGGALAAPRRGRRAYGAASRAPTAAARRCALRARSRPPRDPRRPGGRQGPDGDHVHLGAGASR